MKKIYYILTIFLLATGTCLSQNADSLKIESEVNTQVQKLENLIRKNDSLTPAERQYVFSLAADPSGPVAYNSALSGSPEYNQIKLDYPTYHNSPEAEAKLHNYEGVDLLALNNYLSTINANLNRITDNPIILVGLDAFTGRAELLREFKTNPNSLSEDDVQKKSDFQKAFNHYAMIEERVISKVGQLTGRRVVVIRFGGIQAVIPSVTAGDDISVAGKLYSWRNFVDSKENADFRKLVLFNFNPVYPDQETLITFINRIDLALRGELEIVDCNAFAQTIGDNALRNIHNSADMVKKLRLFDKACYEILHPLDRIQALKMVAHHINSGPLDPVGNVEAKNQAIALISTIKKDEDVEPVFEAFKNDGLFNTYSQNFNKWYVSWTFLDFATGPFMTALADLTGRYYKLHSNDEFVLSKLNSANSDRFFTILRKTDKSGITSPLGNLAPTVVDCRFSFDHNTGRATVNRVRKTLTAKICSLGGVLGTYICGWEYRGGVDISSVVLTDPFDFVFVEDADNTLVLDNAPPLSSTIKDPIAGSIKLIPAFYLGVLESQNTVKNVYTVADIAITLATLPSGVGGLVKAAHWTRKALSTVEIIAATDALATGMFQDNYVTQMQQLLGSSGYTAFKTLLLLDALNGFGPQKAQIGDINIETQVNTLATALNSTTTKDKFRVDTDLIKLYNSNADFLAKFGKTVNKLQLTDLDLISWVKSNPLGWPNSNIANIIANSLESNSSFFNLLKNASNRQELLDACKIVCEGTGTLRNNPLVLREFAMDANLLNAVADLKKSANSAKYQAIGGESGLKQFINQNMDIPCTSCSNGWAGFGNRKLHEVLNNYTEVAYTFRNDATNWNKLKEAAMSGSKTTRESGHHTLRVFKDNPNRYTPANIESLDLKFEELPDGVCANCRFDVKFTENAGKPRFAELKSYQKSSWDKIKTSRPFLNQFKSYLTADDVSNLDDFNYLSNVDKADLNYVKEAFREMFKQNAREIFDTRRDIFSSITIGVNNTIDSQEKLLAVANDKDVFNTLIGNLIVK